MKFKFFNNKKELIVLYELLKIAKIENNQKWIKQIKAQINFYNK
jgi:hypothetical protein